MPPRTVHYTRTASRIDDGTAKDMKAAGDRASGAPSCQDGWDKKRNHEWEVHHAQDGENCNVLNSLPTPGYLRATNGDHPISGGA